MENTNQAPISSGFGAHTTAKDVLRHLDLSGKVAIVTGGYSGIGLETTRALAEAGAQVILPMRTPEKAQSAVATLPQVELHEMDLMNPASIDTFAHWFLDSQRPLHILINNAGIAVPPLMRDERGYEAQFATNHLGHFQLTARLWPALKQAGNARVISLSSSAIGLGGVDFDDPNFERHAYDKWKAYGQSKTATALFAIALDERGKDHGVRAFAVDPGAIRTDLVRFMSEEELKASATSGFQYKSTEQGAATSIWCATSPQLEGRGGVYCINVDIASIIQPETFQNSGRVLWGVLPHAIDPELAERLWRMSEAMTGIQFSARGTTRVEQSSRA
ncbi:MAG: SDR family NAD(P)-dependent oxidoreductase [Anaerolineae bacterium]|nr:SDR family NAD(P)-dependent oxidoreductase [Anaerolineae bacterium]